MVLRYSAYLLVMVFTSLIAMVGTASPIPSASSQRAEQASFEAASIKAVAYRTRAPIDARFLPSRFVARNVTLGQLIEQAYGLESREIVGGPAWVRQDLFDVTATANEDTSRDRMMLMLQALLEDRFRLQLGRDTRTGALYKLTLDHPHDLHTPAAPNQRPSVATVREDKNGFLSFRYEGRSGTMAMLAAVLGRELKAPVIDETRLQGNFDFTVRFAYDSAFGGLEPDPNLPTIFTALRNDIGLRLTAARAPIPVYVIRRAEKPSPD